MSRTSLKGRMAITLAALAVLAAGGSAVALATSTTSPNAYAGCLSKAGALSNVHVNPKHRVRCSKGNKLMRWNQTGPAGPPGPQGPAGPAGASLTINGTVVSQANNSVPSETSGTLNLSCPAGDIATGGGGGFPTAGITGLAIADSEPLLTGSTPTGWHLIVTNTSSATATFNESVVCLGAPAAAQAALARARQPVHEAATVRLTAIKR